MKDEQKVLTERGIVMFLGEKGDVLMESQKEIMTECRLEMSMGDYARLARRAMREGCSVEELVARCIAELADK